MLAVLDFFERPSGCSNRRYALRLCVRILGVIALVAVAILIIGLLT